MYGLELPINTDLSPIPIPVLNLSPSPKLAISETLPAAKRERASQNQRNLSAPADSICRDHQLIGKYTPRIIIGRVDSKSSHRSGSKVFL
jgi:hypothetical protein